MSVTALNTEKKSDLVFKVSELQILRAVLDGGGAGAGIKDIRLIDGILNKITSAIPASPTQPAIPEAKEAGKPTPEEHATQTEIIVGWTKTVEEFINTEVAVALNQFELAYIRQKYTMFGQFQTTARVREQILALADKLGV